MLLKHELISLFFQYPIIDGCAEKIVTPRCIAIFPNRVERSIGKDTSRSASADPATLEALPHKNRRSQEAASSPLYLFTARWSVRVPTSSCQLKSHGDRGGN